MLTSACQTIQALLLTRLPATAEESARLSTAVRYQSGPYPRQQYCRSIRCIIMAAKLATASTLARCRDTVAYPSAGIHQFRQSRHAAELLLSFRQKRRDGVRHPIGSIHLVPIHSSVWTVAVRRCALFAPPPSSTPFI